MSVREKSGIPIIRENRIRGVVSWMSYNIIVMSKTPKGERSLRRYGRNRRKEGTLTRGDPSCLYSWEVSQSHSILTGLSGEGLNINLSEIESGVVAALQIVFQQHYSPDRSGRDSFNR